MFKINKRLFYYTLFYYLIKYYNYKKYFGVIVERSRGLRAMNQREGTDDACIHMVFLLLSKVIFVFMLHNDEFTRKFLMMDLMTS